VSGVGYRFRSELRGRWRSWTGLALLLGVVAGGVMTLAATARRTHSVQDRFLTTQQAYDAVFAADCDPATCHPKLARMPSVAAATSVSALTAFVAKSDGTSLQPDPNDACYSGPGRVEVLHDASGRFGNAINKQRFVEGRAANAQSAGEVTISYELAQRAGLGPGSRLRLQFMHDCQDDPATWTKPRTVQVVGVQISPGEVRPPSGPFVQHVGITPALMRTIDADTRLDHGIVVRLNAGASIEQFVAEAGDLGFEVSPIIVMRENTDAIARGIRPVYVSLAVLAAMTALAATLVLAQVLFRQALFESSDDTTLASIGMERRDFVALAMFRAALVGVAAAAFAAIASTVVSAFTLSGLARRLEPAPGIAFDAPTVGVGCAVLIVYAVLVVATSVMWLAGRSRRVERPSRSTVANAVARAGLPPTTVSGVGLALTRGHGSSAVPVLSTFASLTLAVIAVVGSLTFGGSLHHLRSKPALVGWNWDAVVTYPQDESVSNMTPESMRENVERALAQHPGVLDAAPGMVWSPFPEGRELQLGPDRMRAGGFVGFDGSARIGPSVISGRKPSAADEILLAPSTLSDLGLRIGDRVNVVGQDGTWEEPGPDTSAEMRIVGTGVVPIATRLGVGAALTIEGAARLNSTVEAQAWFIRTESGTSTESVVDAFVGAFPGATRSSVSTYAFTDLPDPTLNLEQVDSAPWLFAVLMGAMAAAVLAHAVTTTTRARRRDLAVLRALGFSRGQTMRTVGWQANIYLFGALALGTPLGVLAGVLIWREYAAGLGVVPVAVIPWSTWLVAVAVALVLVLVISLPPAWRATRLRPAVALRNE
jgi:ABC-type lipoprotein release transport system permease subunit